jgi:hypothetical protein
MKLKIFSFFTFLFFSLGFGQISATWGDKFEFKQGLENDLKFVLSDNYNHYLQSNIAEKGMWHYNSIIVRKFDQKNKLVDTFVQSYPKIEANAFTNYLGSLESGIDKLIFFTESYSGKSKKKEIYKIVFDKSTSKFTTSVLATYPIESLMKSGNVAFKKSENGKYGAVVNYAHSPRKEPSKISTVVVDANSTNISWQKDISLAENATEQSFFVTNNGNVGLVRMADYTSKIIYLTSSKQEEKFLPEKVILQNFKDISIGSQEYLVGFNYVRQGIRTSDFENIMLYDLNNGKIIANNAINNYKNVIAKEVEIPYAYVSEGKIYIFTEAKVESGKTVETFPTTIYKYTHPFIYELNSNDGKLLNSKIIDIDLKPLANFNHAFGWVNIKGRIFISDSYKSNLREFDLQNFTFKKENYIENNYTAVSYESLQNQLILYKNDSKQMIMGVNKGDGLSLITYENFTLK